MLDSNLLWLLKLLKYDYEDFVSWWMNGNVKSHRDHKQLLSSWPYSDIRRLKTDLCACVCICCMCVCGGGVHVWGRFRGQCQASSIIHLSHLFFPEKGLSLNMVLINSARLAALWTPRFLSSRFLLSWDYICALLCPTLSWVMGMGSQVLIHLCTQFTS